jgi:integrase
VDRLQDAPQDVRTMAELMLGTGQLPGAAVAMEWADFDGEWMTVTDQKADTRREVYCPPRLRGYLATVPRKGKHVLAKNLTTPLGYSALENQFRRWRDTFDGAADAYSLHGLRKLAVVQLAEAGCSDAEIQAVTGQSPDMVAFYRKDASARALSRKAQERRE